MVMVMIVIVVMMMVMSFLMMVFVGMLFLMVMVVVFLLVMMFQNHIEIRRFHPIFICAANLNGIAVQMQAGKGLLQLVRVCAQIQQGGDGHVAADAGITLKICGLSHGNPSFHFTD